MAIRLSKRQTISIVVAAVLTVAVGLFVWSFAHPFERQETENVETAPPITTNQPASEQPKDPVTEPDTKEVETPTLDPTSVSTVAIDSLGVTVSYVKGVPGFAYSIDQSSSGTRFATFSSEQLVGTKCTDDAGVFATILKDPQQEDRATLTATKTVSGTVYGLSLPSATCTSDSALFDQYQTSFKDAFGLIQPL